MGSPFNATHKFTHLSKPLLYDRQSTIKIKPISKSTATAPCVPQGAASLQKSWAGGLPTKNVALEIRVTRCMRNLWGYLPPPPPPPKKKTPVLPPTVFQQIRRLLAPCQRGRHRCPVGGERCWWICTSNARWTVRPLPRQTLPTGRHCRVEDSNLLGKIW